MAELGPLQVLVLGFEDSRFDREVLDELLALRRSDQVRLVDFLLVTKDDDGNVMPIDHQELTELEIAQMGTIADALIGWGAAEDGLVAGALLGAAPHAPGSTEAADAGLPDDADEWYIADGIPDGGVAAVVLLEHRWAVPLRDAFHRAGGVASIDHFVEPRDMAVLGRGSPHRPMLP
jgi:uncharacterized membrane protein